MSFVRLAAFIFAIAPLAGHATALVDSSFEAKGTGVSNYCYDGFVAGGNAPCGPSAWVGTGVIKSGNGAWGGTTTPAGSYYGFVQGGGVLAQTFTATSTGTFGVTWLDAGRTNYGGAQTYAVSISSGTKTVALGTYTTDGGAFRAESSVPFVTAAGSSYTLRFMGLATDDRTSFVDNVALGAVPEPTTWAMLVAGFGLVGLAARRRSSAVAA